MTHNILQAGIRRLILVSGILSGSFFQYTAMASEEAKSKTDQSIGTLIVGDYKSFYASDRLLRIGIAFGVAGIAANTNVDTRIQNYYQNNIRSTDTNSWSSSTKPGPTFNAKLFGEGKYLLPLSLLSASINLIDQDTAIGNWGASASRAYLTGLPLLWFSQIATGGSRPGETANDSRWRPLKDDNGVSGHAFVGAVPFLTIAYLNPENNYIKYTAYLASTAAAWSRVNDNDHYPSQIFLGWYLAWEAVDAVFENNRKKTGLTVAPMVGIDGFGMTAKGYW